jgi:hypothetical protein
MTTMRNGRMALLALTLAASFGATHAEGFRPVIGTSITGGGETLATVNYTDGTTQKVRSGGLVHIFGGVEYQGASFAVQGNVGYHVDDSNARNGSVKFARVPVELLAFWKLTDSFRLGAGVRKAGSAKLSSSGAASNVGNFTLESKLGEVVQGEYFFVADRASVLFRYVAEDYKVNGTSISGKHAGVGVSWRF